MGGESGGDVEAFAGSRAEGRLLPWPWRVDRSAGHGARSPLYLLLWYVRVREVSRWPRELWRCGSSFGGERERRRCVDSLELEPPPRAKHYEARAKGRFPWPWLQFCIL